MIKNKSQIILLSILGCIVVLYNFILFISTMNVIKLAPFWISYGFIMLSMALAVPIIIVKSPFADGTKLAFTVPIIRIVFAYFVIELFVGTLFMFLQTVTTVKVTLWVQIPILLIFAVIGLLVLLGENHISQNYENQKKDVLSQNLLYVQVETLVSSVQNIELAGKLSIISDKIKFSDFNAYPELAAQDNLIRSTVSEMKCVDNEKELTTLVARLERLVDERNELCKYIKKRRG